MLLDAVLTGAKGINLWSSFRVPPPQRRSRLYRALVDTGLASSVSGGMLPTEQPFLYSISATVTAGTPLAAVEGRLIQELDRVRAEGVSPAELESAKTQLKARLIFDNDSVTNIAHQLGYFETIASAGLFLNAVGHIDSVTQEHVASTAERMLGESNRTIGWFSPVLAHEGPSHTTL